MDENDFNILKKMIEDQFNNLKSNIEIVNHSDKLQNLINQEFDELKKNLEEFSDFEKSKKMTEDEFNELKKKFNKFKNFFILNETLELAVKNLEEFSDFEQFKKMTEGEFNELKINIQKFTKDTFKLGSKTFSKLQNQILSNVYAFWETDKTLTSDENKMFEILTSKNIISFDNFRVAVCYIFRIKR